MSRFDDIINLPHPVSKKHPQMSNLNRGAQFAPFAALVGYDKVISESGRLTDEKIQIDEYERDDINNMLIYLSSNKSARINIVYFLKDKYKNGGEYLSKNAYIKKIDTEKCNVILSDNTIISMDDIKSITLVSEE